MPFTARWAARGRVPARAPIGAAARPGITLDADSVSLHRGDSGDFTSGDPVSNQAYFPTAEGDGPRAAKGCSFRMTTVRFGHGPQAKIEVLTVVEADPPRRFAFRWVADDGKSAAPGNSLLVTFELVPAGTGTLLRFTETGFRERGWEAATLEEAYQDHVHGWDHFLPRLVDYAAKAATR